MSEALLDEVRTFLADFEAIQEALGAHFSRKRAALVDVRPQDISLLTRAEEELVERMRRLHARRARLLQQANAAGEPAGSLRELATRIGGKEPRFLPETGALAERIDLARVRTDRLRRENWVQWIIAQRAGTHYGELIELIAERGRRSPTYEASDGPPGGGNRRTGSRERTGQGAILDASA